METLLQKQLSSERYTISKKPFYNWLSKNLPQFKSYNALEIDSGSYELWESIYRNFIQSNITISNPLKKNLSRTKSRLEDYRINYEVQHSYNMTYANSSMDFIISNNNNFIQNKNSIKEVKRVLNSKGLFVNIINGDNHIKEFKELFNKGIVNNKPTPKKHKIKYKYNELKKDFSEVSFREYTRKLNIKDPNSVLGYYLSNRNPKVREWALEDSSWILNEANIAIRCNGSFQVTVNIGMFVCKK